MTIQFPGRAANENDPYFTLAEQKTALLRAKHLMSRWEIDQQDFLCLLGLAANRDWCDASLNKKLMPTDAQLRLAFLDQLERVYLLMPDASPFGSAWLRSDNPDFEGMAPIDVILSEDWRGLSDLVFFLTRKVAAGYRDAFQQNFG